MMNGAACGKSLDAAFSGITKSSRAFDRGRPNFREGSVLVRIQSKVETDGPWCLVDGWSFAEFEILPRVGELISLQHIANQGVWLRVDHIVHTPNNVRPTSAHDTRPYQAILFVQWLSRDAVLAPGAAVE